MKVWLENSWVPEHPGATITYDALKANPPHELLGVDRETYLSSLDAFRLSGRYDRMEPNRVVLEWFQAHGAGSRHVALTRAPMAAAHISAAWVMKHFGVWIRTFHLIPSPRRRQELPVYDGNKGEYLAHIGGADLLIDDAMDNAGSALESGVKTLLFPRPWNTSRMSVNQLLDEITRIVKR
ncbi:MAG: hypothetical protein C0404_13490 [Verrucomicrobia bacterium]|nr:hypothetical protein [Verrucomicrobiota bacterium]